MVSWGMNGWHGMGMGEGIRMLDMNGGVVLFLALRLAL
jgi:hypothetical protein